MTILEIELAEELAKENKKTQDRFKRVYQTRIKRMKKGLFEIPQTEKLTSEEKRTYLAYITLKDLRAVIKTEQEKREKFDLMISEKFPHLNQYAIADDI